MKYVAEGNLSCGDRTTDRVLLRGALIGTEGSDSSDLHAQLQSWVDAGPTVEVRGIPLTVIACSTYPGGEASCQIQSPTNPVVETEGQASSTFGGIPLYAAVAGGVALLLGVIVVIIVLVGVRRRQRRRKRYRLVVRETARLVVSSAGQKYRLCEYNFTLLSDKSLYSFPG